MKKMKNSLYLLEELNKDDIKNKKILLRVDFNVPLSKDLMVEDDTRIRAALNTINYLLSYNCTIILISHLGRPNGKIVEELRLNPIAKSLENIIKRDVIKLDDCIGCLLYTSIMRLTPSRLRLSRFRMQVIYPWLPLSFQTTAGLKTSIYPSYRSRKSS